MTQPSEDNSTSNLQVSLIESFLSFIANSFRKITAILLIIVTVLFIIKYSDILLSFIDFNLTDPQILLPLGVSTGLVFYLTTMLATPIPVALGIGLIIYLVINSII